MKYLLLFILQICLTVCTIAQHPTLPKDFIEVKIFDALTGQLVHYPFQLKLGFNGEEISASENFSIQKIKTLGDEVIVKLHLQVYQNTFETEINAALLKNKISMLFEMNFEVKNNRTCDLVLYSPGPSRGSTLYPGNEKDMDACNHPKNFQLLRFTDDQKRQYGQSSFYTYYFKRQGMPLPLSDVYKASTNRGKVVFHFKEKYKFLMEIFDDEGSLKATESFEGEWFYRPDFQKAFCYFPKPIRADLDGGGEKTISHLKIKWETVEKLEVYRDVEKGKTLTPTTFFILEKGN